MKLITSRLKLTTSNVTNSNMNFFLSVNYRLLYHAPVVKLVGFRLLQINLRLSLDGGNIEEE